jgi:hypothetical protein
MSWQCVRCRELIDEPFDACWNCGTSRSGVRDWAFRRAERVKPEELIEEERETISLPPARIQFSVRFLLRLTTLAAIAFAMGLAVWWEFAIVVFLLAVWTAVGMLLTGLLINTLFGLAGLIQRPGRRR